MNVAGEGGKAFMVKINKSERTSVQLSCIATQPGDSGKAEGNESGAGNETEIAVV